MPAIIAIAVGVIALFLLIAVVKIAFKLLGFAIALGLAVFVYFIVEKFVGKGR